MEVHGTRALSWLEVLLPRNVIGLLSTALIVSREFVIRIPGTIIENVDNL